MRHISAALLLFLACPRVLRADDPDSMADDAENGGPDLDDIVIEDDCAVDRTEECGYEPETPASLPPSEAKKASPKTVPARRGNTAANFGAPGAGGPPRGSAATQHPGSKTLPSAEDPSVPPADFGKKNIRNKANSAIGKAGLSGNTFSRPGLEKAAQLAPSPAGNAFPKGIRSAPAEAEGIPSSKDAPSVPLNPGNPRSAREFQLAHSPYRAAFDRLGLTLRDGRVVGAAGRPATPQELSRLSEVIRGETRALIQRPDFHDILPRERLGELKSAYRASAGEPLTDFKHIDLEDDERDFKHSESCSPPSPDCNRNAGAKPYKKGSYVTPEMLSRVWSSIFSKEKPAPSLAERKLSRNRLREGKLLARLLGKGENLDQAAGPGTVPDNPRLLVAVSLAVHMPAPVKLSDKASSAAFGEKEKTGSGDLPPATTDKNDMVSPLKNAKKKLKDDPPPLPFNRLYEPKGAREFMQRNHNVIFKERVKLNLQRAPFILRRPETAYEHTFDGKPPRPIRPCASMDDSGMPLAYAAAEKIVACTSLDSYLRGFVEYIGVMNYAQSAEDEGAMLTQKFRKSAPMGDIGDKNKGIIRRYQHKAYTETDYNLQLQLFYSIVNGIDDTIPQNYRARLTDRVGAGHYAHLKPGWVWRLALKVSGEDPHRAIEIIGFCGHDDVNDFQSPMPLPDGLSKAPKKHLDICPSRGRNSAFYAPGGLDMESAGIGDELAKDVISIQSGPLGTRSVPAKHYHVLGAAAAACEIVKDAGKTNGIFHKNAPFFETRAAWLYRVKRLGDEREAYKKLATALKEEFDAQGKSGAAPLSEESILMEKYVTNPDFEAFILKKVLPSEALWAYAQQPGSREAKVLEDNLFFENDSMVVNGRLWRNINISILLAHMHMHMDIPSLFSAPWLAAVAIRGEGDLAKAKTLTARLALRRARAIRQDIEWSVEQHRRGAEFAVKHCRPEPARNP